MGRVTLERRTFSVNKDTNIIINAYMQCLAGAGLIKIVQESNQQLSYTIEEGAGFDARLIPGSTLDYTGVGNAVIRKFEFFTGGHYGGTYQVLDAMVIDIDNDLDDIFQTYSKEWSLRLEKVGEKIVDIADTEIESPHILSALLIHRLIAYVLAEENLIKIKHEKLINVIELFIKRITINDKNSPFKTRWHKRWNSYAAYLLNGHREFVDSFKSSLEMREALESHRRAVTDAQNLLARIEVLIKRQIIAYWNPKIAKGWLSDQYYAIALDKIENKVLQRYLKSLSSEERVQVLKLNDRQKHEAILRYAKSRNKKYEHIETILKLYTILNKTVSLKKMIIGVKSFIGYTGWIGLLAGIIDLSAISNEIKNHILNNAKLLNSALNGLPEGCSATNELIQYSAQGIESIGDVVITANKLKALNNPALHRLVAEKIYESVEKLYVLQNELNIPIVNIDKLKNMRELLSIEYIDNPAKPEKSVEAVLEEQFAEHKTTHHGRKHLRDRVRHRSHHGEETTKTTKTKKSEDKMIEVQSEINLTAEELEKQLFKMDESFKLAYVYLRDKDYAEAMKILLLNFDSYSEDVIKNEENLKIYFNLFRNRSGYTLLHAAVENKWKEQITWLCNKIEGVLEPIENTNKTALLMAADLIQTDHKDIFFELCKKAKEETEPSTSTLIEYVVLHELSEEVVSFLHNKFVEYNGKQEWRMNNFWYLLGQEIADFFGNSHTVKRAQEVAEGYLFLKEIRYTQDYKKLESELIYKLDHSQNNSKGSFLHKAIREALEKMKMLLQDKAGEYRNEIQLYTDKNKIVPPNSSASQIVGYQKMVIQMKKEGEALLKKLNEERMQAKKEADEAAQKSEEKHAVEIEKLRSELEGKIEFLVALVKAATANQPAGQQGLTKEPQQQAYSMNH